MNPLKSLTEYGQAVWLDFLARDFVAKGGLATLIKRDGLTGVTSNPAIFEKAIDAGGDYLGSLEEAERNSDVAPIDLYEHLALPDIQTPPDALRPAYAA